MSRFCEAQAGFRNYRLDRPIPPRSPVCFSDLHRLGLPRLETYRRCYRCGLILDLARRGRERTNLLIKHYNDVDPHFEVASSKTAFFQQVLRDLDVRVAHRPRRLVDVGCGHGYFLGMASDAGWGVLGVDILPAAVRTARKRIPGQVVIEGDLRQAQLKSSSLQAVTLWDVLDQLEDPAAELEECLRILAPGGSIAIRVRNAAAQLWIHRCCGRIQPLWRMLGLKPLSTFHRYGFSRFSLERLLEVIGFVDISARNSPLTKGDPYQHTPLRGFMNLGKPVVWAVAQCAYRLTRGRRVIGPSLLVWARKP
jgi:SAM-dependent methyltransferase